MLKKLSILYLKSKKQKMETVYFEYNNACFNSKAFTINNSLEISGALDRSSEEILNRIAGWTDKRSGWSTERIDGHYVSVVKYAPLRGRSYMPLPKELCNSKKGLINLKNSDDKCLLWCLVRHKNPRNIHPEKITQSDRKFAKDLDLKGISFPVTIAQIPQIERQD